jgi:hypothetical protein
MKVPESMRRSACPISIDAVKRNEPEKLRLFYIEKNPLTPIFLFYISGFYGSRSYPA